MGLALPLLPVLAPELPLVLTEPEAAPVPELDAAPVPELAIAPPSDPVVASAVGTPVPLSSSTLEPPLVAPVPSSPRLVSASTVALASLAGAVPEQRMVVVTGMSCAT